MDERHASSTLCVDDPETMLIGRVQFLRISFGSKHEITKWELDITTILQWNISFSIILSDLEC